MILEINNLTKSFEKPNETIYPVNSLYFSMNEGDYVVIKGRSGTGKSTLLNLIGIFLDPDEGEILYKGNNIIGLDDQEASKYRSQEVSYLTQNLDSIPTLTVFENIILPYYISLESGGEINEEIESKVLGIMESLNLLTLKDDKVRNLSGGEKKRLTFARSLVNDPSLLLLDEPTADLDDENATDILNILDRLNSEGMSIIVVTHDEAFDEKGRLFKMSDGKLFKN